MQADVHSLVEIVIYYRFLHVGTQRKTHWERLLKSKFGFYIDTIFIELEKLMRNLEICKQLIYVDAADVNIRRSYCRFLQVKETWRDTFVRFNKELKIY